MQRLPFLRNIWSRTGPDGPSGTGQDSLHLAGIDLAGTGLVDKLAGIDPADTAGEADPGAAAD
jgi:hypothetical protein